METTKITSAQNPTIKTWSTFNRRKSPTLIRLDGAHLHFEYLKATNTKPEITLVSERFMKSSDWDTFKNRLNCRAIPDDLMAKLSPSKSPSGILSLADRPVPLKPSAQTLVVIFETLQDPGNLGTMLRTSLAMGVNEVLILGNNPDIWSDKCLRAGMGAQFYLPVNPIANLSEWKKTFSGPIVATSLSGKSLWENPLAACTALVFGNEGQGLSSATQALCDVAIKIPMHEQSESLNVASSLAILTHEWARQHGT